MSCTEHKPQIVDTFWQINLRHNPATHEMQEELSLYVTGDDSDGMEDLKALYIINDQHHRYWNILASEWDTHQIREEQWVGSSRLVNGRKPHWDRGVYRLILMDTGGSQDERDININSNIFEWQSIPFPSIQVSHEGIRIEGDQREYLIFYYDVDGTLISSIHTLSGYSTWDQLKPSSQDTIDYIEVYTLWEEEGLGLITGPYVIPHA